MSSVLHVTAVFDLAFLTHAIRDDDTLKGNDGWFPFESVGTKISDPKPIDSSACASTISDDLHICAIDPQGVLWHTIRQADDTWPFPFGHVQAQTNLIGPNQGIGPTLRVACATNQNGDLH